jgi:transcriptional regulator with XRE-family HTH domain
MTNWISKTRKEQGISQADLAEATGITRARMAQLESGEAKLTAAGAAKLCGLLGLRRRGRAPGSAAAWSLE